jgi:hypothetical protein
MAHEEDPPTIIEGTLLYHLVRTSTIHANVPEEFFQKLERNWPQVMEQVGTLVDQLMQGCGNGISNVHRLLPRLTVNRRFMSDFLAAKTPCFAIGLVEERQRPCGFLALRPDETIPPGITDAGFRFGHSLLGNADYEVVHFAFEFYGFKRYNVLVNPGNPLVKAVLSTMVESGDYFFFAVSDGSATSFRSEIGQKGMAGLETNFPRILRSTTTDAQYRKAVSAFEKNPDPPGTMLHWICRDCPDYLDLTRDRLELNPA